MSARDCVAGLVVALVALPLCLGIALASDVPPAAGLIAGVIGGIVVGALSGSHTSVTGPAAGLSTIVASQIHALGSFEAFLVAVMLSGMFQIGLSAIRAGALASFVPTSVIHGLTAAIGLVLVLKQIPHLLGHDPDPMGEESFDQPDGRTTLTELWAIVDDMHFGAAVVGLTSIAVFLSWSKFPKLDRRIPAPLIVIGFSLALSELLSGMGADWAIEASHRVQLSPTADHRLTEILTMPDWSRFDTPGVYWAALTLAVVGSLETLLNLQASDELDPKQRRSPANRELFAQGAGNLVSGALGGLPMTSVVVRSGVNVFAGATSRWGTIIHGIGILLAVLLLPRFMDTIPLAALAAILLVYGLRLVHPRVFVRAWLRGKRQFLPFVGTVGAIVFGDILVGVLFGLAVSVWFVLHSTFRHPLRRILEHHAAQDVLRIELASQVGFFHRPALEKALRDIPDGGHVLIDARDTDFVDADVLDWIEHYRDEIAPAHRVEVSLLGFGALDPDLADEVQYVDHSSFDARASLTPDRVVEVLRQGNQRFRSGRRLSRDLVRQVGATGDGQAPMAVVLGCVDSRVPAEIVFDLGIGDIMSVRIAGNVVTEETLGSLEFACAVAGAKLIVVMGHTSCGAVKTAVDLHRTDQTAMATTGCEHVDVLVDQIRATLGSVPSEAPSDEFLDEVTRLNVLRSLGRVGTTSTVLSRLVAQGTVGVVGALYDVKTGEVSFMIPDE